MASTVEASLLIQIYQGLQDTAYVTCEYKTDCAPAEPFSKCQFIYTVSALTLLLYDYSMF